MSISGKSNQNVVEKVEGFCSICWGKDRYRGMVMQQCKECKVLYHTECYGLSVKKHTKRVRDPTTGKKILVGDPNHVCWACQWVGRSFKGRTKSGVTYTVKIQSRPTECCLCSQNVSVQDYPLAMHPAYDYPGLKGRPLLLEDMAGNVRPAWAHTLCAFFVNTYKGTSGCFFGCWKSGEYEGEEEGGDEDLSVNSETKYYKLHGDDDGLGKDDDDDSSTSGSSSSNESEDELGGTIHHFVFVLKKNRRTKTGRGRYGYENDWTKAIADHQKLKCIFCKDNNNSPDAAFRIPVQCCANTPEEYEHERDCHDKGDDCFQSMHVGCAIWGRDERGRWPDTRRIYFFPSPQNDEFNNVVTCVLCPLHARDYRKHDVEGWKWLRYPDNPGGRSPAAMIASLPTPNRNRASSAAAASKTAVRPKAMVPVRPTRGIGIGVPQNRVSNIHRNSGGVAAVAGRTLKLASSSAPAPIRPNRHLIAKEKIKAATASAAVPMDRPRHSAILATHRQRSTSTNITVQEIVQDVWSQIEKFRDNETQRNLLLNGRMKYWKRHDNLSSDEFELLWPLVKERVLKKLGVITGGKEQQKEKEKTETIVDEIVQYFVQKCKSSDGDLDPANFTQSKKFWREKFGKAYFKELWTLHVRPRLETEHDFVFKATDGQQHHQKDQDKKQQQLQLQQQTYDISSPNHHDIIDISFSPESEKKKSVNDDLLEKMKSNAIAQTEKLKKSMDESLLKLILMGLKLEWGKKINNKEIVEQLWPTVEFHVRKSLGFPAATAPSASPPAETAAAAKVSITATPTTTDEADVRVAGGKEVNHSPSEPPSTVVTISPLLPAPTEVLEVSVPQGAPLSTLTSAQKGAEETGMDVDDMEEDKDDWSFLIVGPKYDPSRWSNKYNTMEFISEQEFEDSLLTADI